MSAPLSFTLPLPPTAGHYLRTFVVRGRIHVQKTQEAHDYMAAAKMSMLIKRMVPFEGDVSVTLNVYRERNGKFGGDIDNFCKCTCDAMSGFAYADDTQIAELIVRRHNPPAGSTKAAKAEREKWQARVEVTVSPMDKKK